MSTVRPPWSDPKKRETFLRGVLDRLLACADVLWHEGYTDACERVQTVVSDVAEAEDIW